MSDLVLFSDPGASFIEKKVAIRAALDRSLISGWYVLGKEVEAFEDEFAAFHGEDFHTVGVGNGTDAIALALRSLGLGQGEEVVTVSHTAVATVAGIEQAGCVPTFVDIDPCTRCMNPEKLPTATSQETKAIVVVHLYGQPAPMPEILHFARESGLLVVEDCAQALGAHIDEQKVGTFGDVSTFSFYPTKNLGALGDGGAILTSDKAVADEARSLRQYGWNDRRESLTVGINSRLDELQAAILRAKLPELEADNELRRSLASRYLDRLGGSTLALPIMTEGETHAMHLFVVESENRDALLAQLRKGGIGTAIHYPLPVHLQAAYQGRLRGTDDLQATETLGQRVLSLPLYPELPAEAVERTCKAILEWEATLT